MATTAQLHAVQTRQCRHASNCGEQPRLCYGFCDGRHSHGRHRQRDAASTYLTASVLWRPLQKEGCSNDTRARLLAERAYAWHPCSDAGGSRCGTAGTVGGPHLQVGEQRQRAALQRIVQRVEAACDAGQHGRAAPGTSARKQVLQP